MKNKKLLTLLATVIMGGTLLGGGAFAACKTDDSEEEEHQHSWSTTEYGHDDKNHWRECTDEECDEVYQVEPHDFTNGDCVCGVKKPTEDPDKPDPDKPDPEKPDPDDPDKPDPDKPPVIVEYDTVTTDWDAAAAAAKYGSDQTTKDITIGIIKFGAGVFFKDGGVNTQGRDITVTLDGETNSISFNGSGQSSSKITQFTLFKDGADVTPSDWATESKAKRAYTVENLAAGTYTIKTSASGLITDLKITEQKKKGEATSIKAVTTNGAKTSYLAGETFSSEGLQVYLVYDNGREDLLTDGYTVDDSAVNMSEAGTYEVTVTYTAKSFTTKYEITVTAVATENALTLYTTKLNNQIPRSVQKVFKVGDTLNSENLTVYVKPAEGDAQMLASNQYSVALKDGQDMTTAGEKTAVVSTTFGAKAEYKIYVLDLSAVDKTGGASVSVDKGATVGVNGNVVTVNTVTDAVKVYELLALQSNVVKPINVADGEYYENVYINVPNIRLNGSDTKKVEDGGVANGEDKNNGVVIWFDALAGAKDPVGSTYGTFGSASVYVGSGASNFVANNITFKNKYNTSALFNQSKEYLQTNFQNGNTQAVALRVDSDRAEFYNCKMTGYHDTLFIYGGNHYYENCWIEGHTDYIFGCDSNAYFYKCRIFSIGDGNADNGGYVVANRPDENKAEGTHISVFNACDFDGDMQVTDGTVALGRAWGVNMKMAVIDSTISCKFSTAQHTTGTGKGERYCSMGSNPVNEPKPEYMMEYNNDGDGKITASIENTCTYLSEADAAAYAKENAKLKAILGFYPGEVDMTRIFDFGTLDNKNNTAYTADNPAKPFGENALSIVGSFRQQNGAGIQIVAGSVITLHVQGEVTVDWWGGNLGTSANGIITYKNGYATIQIVNDTVATGGIYIKKITVDTATPGVHEHVYPDDWTITPPTATAAGSATKPCQDCELEEAYVDSKVLPALGSTYEEITANGYTIKAGTNTAKPGVAGTGTYLITVDGIAFEFTAETPALAADAHAHVYPDDWTLTAENYPTAESEGTATKTCTDADCDLSDGATITLKLPALTDSGYTITNNTAEPGVKGTGTYSITVQGATFTFEAETAALPTQYVFDTTFGAQASSWSNAATPTAIMNGAMTIQGEYKPNGNSIQVKAGTVIKMAYTGQITVTWFGGNWGDTDNGTITYKNGCATLTIKQSSSCGTNGIYIKQIDIDHTVTPGDTKYTVTFDTGESGPTVASAEVLAYGKVTKPTDPVLDGYTFIGWFKDEAYSSAFDFENDTITADTTLYAKWKNNSVQTFNLSLKVWGNEEATTSVEDGQKLTAETVETLLAAKGYKNCHAELYTDEAFTTPLTEAITADGNVYVKVVYNVSAKIDLLEYDGTEINGTIGYWRGIKIDASATLSKFSPPASSWCQFNAGTVLSFYVKPGTTATITQLNGEHTFAVDANGLATITSGGGYIRDFTLNVPKIYNVGDSVELAGSGVKLNAGQSTKYQDMDITAGTDKFQDNNTYLHAGAGSTISFKVADGITQANLKVVFVDHNGNANSYQAGTHFTVTVDEEQHVATITVGAGVTMYLKSMNIASNS